eukprot:3635451-Rhodomonas_salina.1
MSTHVSGLVQPSNTLTLNSDSRQSISLLNELHARSNPKIRLPLALRGARGLPQQQHQTHQTKSGFADSLAMRASERLSGGAQPPRFTMPWGTLYGTGFGVSQPSHLSKYRNVQLHMTLSPRSHAPCSQ